MKYLVVELIRKKRDGYALNADEIAFLVKGFCDGSIPDYQISSWLMAVFYKGMTPEETHLLTREMKNSGEQLKWRDRDPSFLSAKFADKHSTGGVGDKVSLILAPVAACLGLKIPMMSGRGLGFTGGTVDKFQSIAGFKLDLPDAERTRVLKETGICMMAQSETLCPADRKLYALRDVTCTVESLSLITSSIVSKKWAAGVENIVYDVKCGSAAFMNSLPKAKELALSLVNVSKLAGMKATALITRMDEPLGAFIGNALEVRECIFILKNSYPEDFHEYLAAPLAQLSCRLAAEMAVLAGLYPVVEEAYNEALRCLTDGRAWEVFQKMIRAQGGTEDWHETLPKPIISIPFKSPKPGYLKAIHSRYLGLAGIKLKAGRELSTDVIDPTTGFELFKGVGQKIERHEILCLAHLKNEAQLKEIEADLLSAFEISDTPVSAPPELVLEKIS